jgi:hypothetical protein
MEMLKKLKKRIVPLVLAVVIFATSVVSGPASLTAQAASVAVSPEMSVEFVMMLYNIFETISIASGIKDGLDDYESGMSLFEAFISFLDSIKFDPIKEFSVYGPDGNLLTDEYMDALLASAVGAGKLKVRPNEGEFAKYRVLTGGLTPTPSPDPSASPSPSPIPGPGHGTDLNPNIPKRGIGAFAMGTDMQFQRAAADFLNRVQNNEVPDVDPAKYYDQGELFTGYPTESNAGKVNIHVSYHYNGSANLSEENYSYNTVDEKYYYFLATYGTTTSGSYIVKPGIYDISSGSVRFPCYWYMKDDSGNDFSFNWITYPVPDTGYRYTNYLITSTIPVFKEFVSYCKGDSSQLLYAPDNLPYDYHSMAAAAPDTLENLSGTKLDPAKVPAMNNAMKEAANGVEATGTDKEANNAEMIAAVKAAVAEALAEAQPDPAPEPTAAPDPKPSTAPDPGTDTNYSGILGLILSAIKAISSGIWNFFCDPMGAITTGLTNLYNGVLRIIEIFPEQVQLVLGNIASLPSAMLQVFADPLGAIQSLLGALPSWANLQGYLDKILDALVNPGSLLEPSDPGGEDPGGDDSGGGSKFNLLSLLNGLIYLILILILLLKIFIHCLQFIINIFKIEASPGFLPDEMVMGLNFLKQIEITGIGLSIYDFMMGLVYILMVFGVVKLLRGYAYKIHIPSGGGK